MNTGYRNQQYQSTAGTDPGWMLICAVFILALGLIALPWIILGVLVERTLSRWLHWRLSFLLWFMLLFVGAFVLYNSYQHGLQHLIIRELTAYIVTVKHYQTDFMHWPLRLLWADTAQSLRQNERKRQQRVQRSQRRARRRSIRPEYVPDVVGDMMVIGIPIHDKLEGE